MSRNPYALRSWEAWSYVDKPIQGTTKPVFYECGIREETPTNFQRSETFLVKSLESVETMARELVGNRLAQAVGLRTPEPALIHLSPEVVETVNDTLKKQGRYPNQRPGWASGARHFSAGNVTELQRVPETYFAQAAQLYAFDMLALHTDRTLQNPNCAATSEGLLVFDFERCFVADEEEQPRDWPLWRGAVHGLGPLHMFYTGLRRSTEVEQVARRTIDALTERRLELCLAGLPEDWLPEGFRIVEQVRLVRRHADEFVESIVQSLNH